MRIDSIPELFSARYLELLAQLETTYTVRPVAIPWREEVGDLGLFSLQTLNGFASGSRTVRLQNELRRILRDEMATVIHHDELGSPWMVAGKSVASIPAVRSVARN